MLNKWKIREDISWKKKEIEEIKFKILNCSDNELDSYELILDKLNQEYEEMERDYYELPNTREKVF